MPKKHSRDFTNDGRSIVASCSVRNTIAAPRKVKMVADLVRNKTCGQALEILRFTHKPSGTVIVEKAIRSAMANASRNNPEPLDLVIGEVAVESGRIEYRRSYAPRGRAVPIRKRRSHLHIRLTEL